MMTLTLWLLFLVGGGTTYQNSKFMPQGQNIVSACQDNNRDGKCDPSEVNGQGGGGGVGYGGLNVN